MDIYDDIANELSGDGMIIIRWANVAIIPLAVTGPGDEPLLIAEGSISARNRF